MTRWTRAERPQLCGGCAAPVAVGDPMVTMTIHAGIYAVRTPKVRCSRCEGPVPPDLPDLVTRQATGGGFTKPMRRLTVPKDFRALRVPDA